MQPLIGMSEPLPETGVLTNHSSDFSLVKWSASQPPSQVASQPAGHTDLFMEVAPRPKNQIPGGDIVNPHDLFQDQSIIES